MRIVKFTAENVKKLKAVEITPQGHVVEVTGPNGHGKSSVLDAIYYALAGTEGIPSAVVREGEATAFVKLDLGSLKVTRKFIRRTRVDQNDEPIGTNEYTTSLVVESAEGARFPSPQRMLDDLLGALSFDPLAFMRLRPKEQLEAVKKVVGLDLSALDAERQAYFDARAAANREVKSLEARLSDPSLQVPADTPDEPVDVVALANELQKINDRNKEIEKEARRREQLREKIKAQLEAASYKAEVASKVIEEWRRKVEELTAHRDQQVKELETAAAELIEQANQSQKHLDELPPLGWPVDTAGTLRQIEGAKAVNKNVDAKLHHQKLSHDLKIRQDMADAENSALEQCEVNRREAIAGVTMPVEGLAFGDGEILFNGLPLAVASGGEQLRVSVALAMAANPKLRVLRVKDGSLLDESNLQLLSSMAASADYQVWIERVEDSHGRPCVVMEDGAVKL